jgi:(2R)-3-sulfolactate dehydrogenase (NADP+)
VAAAVASNTLSLSDARTLAARALQANGARLANAASTAAALVAAEADGQFGHGLGRVASYSAQIVAGKVNGHAMPILTQTRAASVRIDARGGLAYPALDLAIATLAPLARETGVAAAGIYASHHIGQAGRSVERLADQGLVALVVSNTPQAMAFHGGAKPMMGTNPLAFAAPLTGRAPLVIDMALTLVARSRIVAAQKAGEDIPADWATDAQGQPTTDPAAALAGALTPAGGAKGAALALMVEILCGALAGGAYGWEASSFLDDKGPSPSVGQVILALDPMAFAGPDFLGRMSAMVATMTAEDGVRLPGDRRLANRAKAAAEGLNLSPALHSELLTLAGGA